jgi:GAF domain-containing protein/HAMP domain-containing protein
VLITSRSISNPIVKMAQQASNLAGGELSARMQADRRDEIGTLASSFNTMADELQSLVKNLEQKVEDRTVDLQKQANYMRVAAEVARDATSAQDLDELLNRSAQLVLDRFGFYHTGIFLLDERKEYAILRASPTAAGREMLSRNHRLKVGQVGIVGYVAATGLSRIALDTGQDSAFFNNPLLPNTRSEIALPLKVGDMLIGVFDVQSENPQAFTQDDIGILQIMADQLALAIQRVRLTNEQQENLRLLEASSQNFTLSSWKSFTQDSAAKPGYAYDGMHISQVESFPIESREALSKGQTLVIPALNTANPNSSALAVPLKVRDQVIGIITIQFNTATISADTISLAEETAGRLSIALENARLYTETQKIAARERAIGEVSNRLTASVNIENILRTTVQEIGRMLPGAEVVVKLEQNSNHPAARNVPAATNTPEPG